MLILPRRLQGSRIETIVEGDAYPGQIRLIGKVPVGVIEVIYPRRADHRLQQAIRRGYRSAGRGARDRWLGL
jgi:hypothetical protein